MNVNFLATDRRNRSEKILALEKYSNHKNAGICSKHVFIFNNEKIEQYSVWEKVFA